MDKPLYECSSDTTISTYDFLDSLRSVGINNHDTIFVHSSILAFGKIIDHSTILQSLVDVIKASVPDGDVLMPTYTYSFTKNEIYDVKKTPSTVGSLTNHFRNMPDVYRTMDPIFSVAVFGDEKYLNCDARNSFGKDSVYSELLESDAKIVMFGSDFSKSLTFLHFVEQQFDVFYRKLKKFLGRKKIEDDVLKDYCFFYVRDPKEIIEVDLESLKNHLINKGLMKTVKIGSGYISCITTRDLYNECFMLLKKDEGFFLSKTCNKRRE